MATTRSYLSRIHISSTIVVIMLGMIVLDCFLVMQNTGNKRTGVLVMLLIGDVCLLFVLRYVGVWVGTEVHSTKRGCSMAEWFLFVFVLDIKLFFVLETAREECHSLMASALEEAKSKSDSDAQLALLPDKITDYTGAEVYPEDLMLSYASIESCTIRESYNKIISICDYSMGTKKVLTLFQAIFLPGLYLLLVGADYLQAITNLRELDEVKMRAFWVVVDLLDLLDLQSSMWEAKQGELPYLILGFIFFYCYIVLIILPPLSLAEMNKRNEMRTHEMIIYMLASFVAINVATTAIRIVLIQHHNFTRVSSVFIGKNIICIFLKGTKMSQIYLAKKGSVRFSRDRGNPLTLSDIFKGTDSIKYSDVIVQSKDRGDVIHMRDEAQVRKDGEDSAQIQYVDEKKRHSELNHVGWLPNHEDGSDIADKQNATANFRSFLPPRKCDSERARDISAWHESYLENVLKEENKDVFAADQCNISSFPVTEVSTDKGCQKISRSVSALIELSSDGSLEKKVRFRKEELSPDESKTSTKACQPLLPEQDKFDQEKNQGCAREDDILSPHSSDTGPTFSSTDMTSTAERRANSDTPEPWDSIVMDKIINLRNNLHQAFGRNVPDTFNEQSTLNPGSIPDGLDHYTDLNEEENIEESEGFPCFLPSPLLNETSHVFEAKEVAQDEAITGCSDIAEILSPIKPVFHPAFVPDAKYVDSSRLDQESDSRKFEGELLKIFRPIQSSMRPISLEGEEKNELDNARSSSMCHLREFSPIRVYSRAGSCSGMNSRNATPKKQMVTKASQTNLLDNGAGNTTI